MPTARVAALDQSIESIAYGHAGTDTVVLTSVGLLLKSPLSDYQKHMLCNAWIFPLAQTRKAAFWLQKLTLLLMILIHIMNGLAIASQTLSLALSDHVSQFAMNLHSPSLHASPCPCPVCACSGGYTYACAIM